VSVREIWDLYLARPELVVLAAAIIGFFLLAAGLAATAILLRVKNERTRRRWERLESRWEDPVVEAVMGSASLDQVWQLVDRSEELSFVAFLIRFARRLAGSERRLIEGLAEPYLARVAEQLERRSPERRAVAVQTLSVLGRRRYAHRLVAALDDPSPLVAMVAARALASRESPDFAAAILSRLRRFEPWRSSFLASMLSSVGPALAPALIRLLADRQADPRARSVAAEALRELHEPSAADVAAGVQVDESDRDLLASTLGLLADVGRAEHAAAIRPHLVAREPIVRARAVAALGSIGAPADLPNLLAALDDASPWVALRAAEALRDAGATKALAGAGGSSHPRAPLARAMLTAGRA